MPLVDGAIEATGRPLLVTRSIAWDREREIRDGATLRIDVRVRERKTFDAVLAGSRAPRGPGARRRAHPPRFARAPGTDLTRGAVSAAMRSVHPRRDPRTRRAREAPHFARVARRLAVVGGLAASVGACSAVTGPTGAFDAASATADAPDVATDITAVVDVATEPATDTGCEPCTDQEPPTRTFCADARVCGIGPLSPPDLAG
jgi:hypothetical protein